jgi:hypothetical protein
MSKYNIQFHNKKLTLDGGYTGISCNHNSVPWTNMILNTFRCPIKQPGYDKLYSVGTSSLGTYNKILNFFTDIDDFNNIAFLAPTTNIKSKFSFSPELKSNDEVNSEKYLNKLLPIFNLKDNVYVLTTITNNSSDITDFTQLVDHFRNYTKVTQIDFKNPNTYNELSTIIFGDKLIDNSYINLTGNRLFDYSVGPNTTEELCKNLWPDPYCCGILYGSLKSRKINTDEDVENEGLVFLVVNKSEYKKRKKYLTPLAEIEKDLFLVYAPIHPAVHGLSSNYEDDSDDYDSDYDY